MGRELWEQFVSVPDFVGPCSRSVKVEDKLKGGFKLVDVRWEVEYERD